MTRAEAVSKLEKLYEPGRELMAPAGFHEERAAAFGDLLELIKAACPETPTPPAE